MIKDGLMLDSSFGYAKFSLHLIPISNKTSRPQIKMKPRYITIHNAGNSKANALANSKYVDTVAGYVSWHFTVDDKAVFQELTVFEIGYHAGDGKGQGNYASIGIEICEHEGIDWEKAKANAIALIEVLMKDLDIPIENVVPHRHWSGKYCPHRILDEGWDKFVGKICNGFDFETEIKKISNSPQRWIDAVKTAENGDVIKYLPELLENAKKVYSNCKLTY